MFLQQQQQQRDGGREETKEVFTRFDGVSADCHFFFVFRSHAQIIDGVKVAKEVKDEVKRDVEGWVAKGHRRPCLMCVLVGEYPASKTYVRKKMEAAQYVGKSVFSLFGGVDSFFEKTRHQERNCAHARKFVGSGHN